MAQRMLTIQPTEQRSLWTTLEELVAPVLAMDSMVSRSSDEVWREIELWLANECTPVRLDSPNSHEIFTEANDFHVGAEIELATQSRSPPECMVPEKGCVLGTDLSEGLMKIVSEHVRKNPSERLKFKFGFSTDQTHESFEKKSNTLIRIFSCKSPEDNMKPLTKAIEDAFWTELDKVKIIVEGNELEIQFDSKPIFKSEVKAAESSIKGALSLGRYKWLTVAQRKLIDEHMSDKSSLNKDLCRKKLAKDFGLEGRCQKPLVFYEARSKLDAVSNSKWGKKLIDEAFQLWFKWIRDARVSSKEPFQWAFKCSDSSPKTIHTPSCALTRFATNIRNFICSQLRIHDKPPVIIRVTNLSDDTFLTGPLSRNTRIKHSTGEAEGYKISISDADGEEIRRVLLCRSSNFYTAFCDFLGANDIDQSENPEGHERRRVGSGNAVAPPSTTKSRKRKHGRQAPS